MEEVRMRSSRRSSLQQTGARRAGALVATCVLAVLTATSCVTTNEVAREANNDSEYTEKLDNLARTFEARDVEKLIALYDQETYSLSFDQQWAFNSGASNHRETLDRMLSNLESLKIELDPDVTVDRTSERVWTTRHFKANAVTKAGREVEISGWHSAIWEERGDRWLIAYEHFNLDPRMIEPPPPPVVMPPPGEPTPPMLGIQDVFFDYDKWDIRPDQIASMNVVLEYMQKYPETAITIEGHCDERGSTRYNIRLGQRRADTTKAWLVEKGIAPERLRTISFGKSRPFEEGRSEDAWQSNRRSHFVVTKGPNPQQP
jgi:peptidoglycan-associated lipoprotein